MVERIRSPRAFTLIELLIVVAIIAILAAIAVPNFLEAQVRSKTSRVKSDHRTLATAMEAYYVDNNQYILCNTFGLAGARPSIPADPKVLERLSTPISYITTGILKDPFQVKRRSGSLITGGETTLSASQVAWETWTAQTLDGVDGHLYASYLYSSMYNSLTNTSGLDRADGSPVEKATAYFMQSAGPMESQINMGGVIAQATEALSIELVYDPTNGTISFGNIFRLAGQNNGPASGNLVTAFYKAGSK